MIDLGPVRQHMDPMAEASRVAVSQGRAGGVRGAGGFPAKTQQHAAQFNEVNWAAPGGGGGGGGAGGGGAGMIAPQNSLYGGRGGPERPMVGRYRC
jgi:hypothetical protein